MFAFFEKVQVNENANLISIILLTSFTINAFTIFCFLTQDESFKENKIPNEVEKLQQQLGILIKKCDIYQEINNSEREYNTILKQQIIANDATLMFDKLIQLDAILSKTYYKINNLDTSEVRKSSLFFNLSSLHNAIEIQSDILSTLQRENIDLLLEHNPTLRDHRFRQRFFNLRTSLPSQQDFSPVNTLQLE